MKFLEIVWSGARHDMHAYKGAHTDLPSIKVVPGPFAYASIEPAVPGPFANSTIETAIPCAFIFFDVV